jgi:hypothetical protein
MQLPYRVLFPLVSSLSNKTPNGKVDGQEEIGNRMRTPGNAFADIQPPIFSCFPETESQTAHALRFPSMGQTD